MKRLFCTILFAVFFVGWMQAAPVDENRALRVAGNFVTLHGGNPDGLVNLAEEKPFTMFYVFGDKDRFVIVSADDVARPILGYSLHDGIQVNNMPDALSQWLADYEKQISYARLQGIKPDAETRAEWAALENVGKPKSVKAGGRGPLLQTRWNQSPYYNALCPYDEVHKDHAVTGCAATAMAQIMRYWEYPSRGTGSHTYESTYGTLSADFSATKYDWANMPVELTPTSSQHQINAVATLMSHCGIAVEITYRVAAEGGSGAMTTNVPQALMDYFGYSRTMNFAYHDYYSTSEWLNLIKNEIDNGRPIFYLGCGSEGGCHAWVCDGYDAENKMHMNWGWGGYGNGYYADGALVPGSEGIGSGGSNEFNSTNIMILDCYPPDGLRMSVDTVYMSVDGDTMSVSVFPSSSGTDWHATTESDWLKLVAAEGEGYSIRGKLTFAADTNWSDASRTATVTINQGRREQIITIMQYSCGTVKTFPYRESFEGLTTSCWHLETLDGTDDTLFAIITTTDYVKEGEHSLQFSYNKKEPLRRQFLISPELQLPSAARITFDYCRQWSYKEHFTVLYSVTDDNAESFIYFIGDGGMNEAGWNSFEGIIPSEARYVAVCYDNVGFEGRFWAIDNIQIDLASDNDCGTISRMPYEQNFDEGLDCWTMLTRNLENMALYGRFSNGQARSPQYIFRFAANKKADNYNQYLVSPRLSLTEPTDLSFYYRRSGNGEERFVVGYSVTGSTPECFIPLGDTVVTSTSEWTEYQVIIPAEARYVSVNYSPYAGKFLYIDDIHLTNNSATEGIQELGKASQPVVVANGRKVEVRGCAGRQVRLYDISGRLLKSHTAQGDVRLMVPAAGVYLLQIGTDAVRKVVTF